MADSIVAAEYELRTYTTAEVSSMTGIPKTAICESAKAGHLRPATRGRVYRFRLSEVERWLAANEGRAEL